MIRVFLTICIVFMFGQAGDPMRVIREKNFYKEGSAAKNRSFTEWLKKPIIGGDEDTAVPRKPVKRSAALNAVRAQGFKDKEAKMRAKLSSLPAAEKVTVSISRKKLYLLSGGQTFREYPVEFGNGLSESGRQGKYSIGSKENSIVYLTRSGSKKSPDSSDSIIIRSKSGGSWIPFLGSKSEPAPGSIAVDGDDMNEVWSSAGTGIPVEIKP